jgi:hypothetical protein
MPRVVFKSRVSPPIMQEVSLANLKQGSRVRLENGQEYTVELVDTTERIAVKFKEARVRYHRYAIGENKDELYFHNPRFSDSWKTPDNRQCDDLTDDEYYGYNIVAILEG